MIAVIFEAWPAGGKREEYLRLAAALRPELEALDGFVSVERFESLAEPGKLLSLSFFRDEDSVERWRNLPGHRSTQSRGRTEIFRHYRLRIAGLIRDYDGQQRSQAPADSRLAHGDTAR